VTLSYELNKVPSSSFDQLLCPNKSGTPAFVGGRVRSLKDREFGIKPRGSILLVVRGLFLLLL
jgi:hypothetical protein